MTTEHVHICTEGYIDIVQQIGTYSTVIRGKGYNFPGSVGCDVEETGNGFIARFPATSPANQDYYVCLGYAQARDLVLALSAFKKPLGFTNEQ
jgi:hypothetical protein